jgi:putative addiction module killer protein
LEAREREIQYYLPLPKGTPAPFGTWRDGLGDNKTKAAIAARIGRLRSGNFSDSKAIGDGAIENRIDFGPGYRIYYGVDGHKIILLCGGDKSTQDTDIKTAQGYWEDYKERTKQNAKEKQKKLELQSRSSRRPPRKS